MQPVPTRFHVDETKGLNVLMDNQNRDYRGQRALMLLRVSTPEQEKGFGWPAQEREIRRKLVEPLGLKLDELRHIIRDTYTGLEFRERPALDQILVMARRHEFDILITDVLDRLGRKGLARELYRMQLRELGVRILTTDPDDHADDDSLVGEMVRLIKGYQAEEELNNIRRRTMNGKRVKAEGDEGKGIEPGIVGSGHRLYGYQYIYNERGKREGLLLKCDVILTEEDGTQWTEVKVVIFIFESAAGGATTRQIAMALNEKGIPSPYIAKGVKYKSVKRPIWQPSVVCRILKCTAYYGDYREFKTYSLEKVPGKKYAPRRKTTEAEQVSISVPAIIMKELFEAAQKGVERNKIIAPRNNRHPEESLLRAGLVKCGNCGGNLTVHRDKRKTNSLKTPAAEGVHYYVDYVCGTHNSLLNACPGASIPAHVVDKAAWEKALEIVRDPSEVDKKLSALRSKDPTADRRKNINKMLTDIRKRQNVFREQLANLIMGNKLDKGTEEFLMAQLHQLADQEDDCQRELARDEVTHEKWNQLQLKLDELHKRCEEMREKISDHNYDPSYDEKRDLVEFFGITATVWKKGHSPRFKIECNPPDIMSLIS